jgi:putative transposase
MPRNKRLESPSGVYHWIARGVNRKKLFRQFKDYDYFLFLIADNARKHQIKIFHYCLMTNHVHMLIHASDLKSMVEFSHYLKRLYAYYQSKTYKITGSTFERMYRSKPVDDDIHLLECARYIDRNPLRAGIAQSPREYPHSSYPVYAECITNKLITLSPAYLALADTASERQRLYIHYIGQFRPQDEFADKSLIGL